ncbi:hypothetical protein NIES22_41260 [Calothrix brevissima NIES-22]|nr:hypothetical protein NIES22_41260 [Calothrix brevissima NIES-22]
MKAKTLSPEQLKQIAEIEKELAELKRENKQQISLVKDILLSKLYCN